MIAARFVAFAWQDSLLASLLRTADALRPDTSSLWNLAASKDGPVEGASETEHIARKAIQDDEYSRKIVLSAPRCDGIMCKGSFLSC